MPEFESTTETIRRLAALVVENDLAELTVESDGLIVSIKGASEQAAHGSHAAGVPHAIGRPLPPPSWHPPSPAPASAPSVTGDRPARPTTRMAQEAPMVGLFYQAPSPTDPPFISVGDVVHVGQTVGLIEAMKVYSEIPSEVAGRVVEIVAENGKLVQQGQALFYVEPL